MGNQFRKTRRKLAKAGRHRNRRRAQVVRPPPPAAGQPLGEGSADQPGAEEAASGARRVGLWPGWGWHRRNFLTEVLLPSLFARRFGTAGSPAVPPDAPGPDRIGVTWIGHASFLVQMGGLNILVDPIWSLWLKGFKRLRLPGVALHELPLIDLVLVTHAHFDHLDKRTLRAVAANQPIVVPSGVGNLVHRLGFERVHELDCWGRLEQGALRITLTPCHHWGARVLHDQHRGFGGFLLEAAGRSLLHAGDSAYFDGFKEISRRCGPVEVALLPIGAYDAPSGRSVHMNPEEAVQSFLDLRSRWLVPMHYGTFRLSYEPLDEPPRRLLARAAAAGVADQVRLLDEGETALF